MYEYYVTQTHKCVCVCAPVIRHFFFFISTIGIVIIPNNLLVNIKIQTEIERRKLDVEIYLLFFLHESK